MNGFGTNGAKAIGMALEANCTLTSLDLSNNRVNIEGCASIARALGKNDTIKEVYVSLFLFFYFMLFECLSLHASWRDILFLETLDQQSSLVISISSHEICLHLFPCYLQSDAINHWF